MIKTPTFVLFVTFAVRPIRHYSANRDAMKLSYILALFALALAQNDLAAAAEARKITLSYSAVSMTWFPVKVAIEKGFFRGEGLEPQLIQMNGNVATIALANGYIDFP